MFLYIGLFLGTKKFLLFLKHVVPGDTSTVAPMYLCSVITEKRLTLNRCEGAFADLGRDNPVVGEALLYEGLGSRRFLVSDVNGPAVHAVLLTGTLRHRGNKVATLG